MARFDVYKINDSRPLVLDVQADTLNNLETRVIVPLLPLNQTAKNKLDRLHPVIKINDRDYVLRTAEISAIPAGFLHEQIDNLEENHRDDITNALDFLFQGF